MWLFRVLAVLLGVPWYRTLALSYISLMAHDMTRFLIRFSSIFIIFSEEHVRVLGPLLNPFLCFLIVELKSSSHTLDNSPLSGVPFASIFPSLWRVFSFS